MALGHVVFAAHFARLLIGERRRCARHGFTAERLRREPVMHSRNTSRAGRTDDSRGRHRRTRGPALFTVRDSLGARSRALHRNPAPRRTQYISRGCMYCHSQQAARGIAPDAKRGWGRATVAGDYAYDDRPARDDAHRTRPHEHRRTATERSMASGPPGTSRAPMCLNSIMPAYPFLFEIRDKAEAGETVVTLPPGFAPKAGRGRTPEALELVSYLKSLDRSYPAVEAATEPSTRRSR